MRRKRAEEQDEQPADEVLDELVVREINTAYYAGAVGAPDRARARALNGFTVTSAITGALVAGGLAGGFAHQPTLVRAIGCGAAFLWLAAASVYLAAVAGGRSTQPKNDGSGRRGTATKQSQTGNEAQESAQRVIKRTTDELRGIRFLTTIALVLSLLAVLATAALLGLAVFGHGVRRDAIVVLTPAGAQALARACGDPSADGTRSVRARVNPDAIGEGFVDLAVDARTCARGSADVRLASGMIRAVSFASR